VSRLTLCEYRRLARVAEQAGFVWVRRSSSHNTFRHPDGRTVVIPDHGSQVIVRPLLRHIIRDLGLSVDEYNDLLDQV
jgi:predicted RNA binding protein YcfA (HicA-like mRNA interferase family)